MNFDIMDKFDPISLYSPWKDTESEAYKLINQIEDRREHYIHDEVFMLFGDDFRYKDASLNYKNMDAMISYINKHHGDKYNLFYSTPSIYVDAIAKYNVSWPTKYDDLFPYSD
jgi:hypothetical protein